MIRANKLRAQSAMEYLMTYGWAILIIAVVLGALYSLGIFSGSSFATPACIAQSGFYCQNQVLHNGVLSFSLGQAFGGTSWGAGNVVFVPYGKSYVGCTSPDACYAFTSLSSGQQITPTITLTTASCGAVNTIGGTCQGQIWVNYTISGTAYVLQAASVTVKVS